MVQCLVERRAIEHGADGKRTDGKRADGKRADGKQWGETGVRQVRCLEGDAVWRAFEEGLVDRRLLHEALARLRQQPLPAGKSIEEIGRNPVLYVVDYRDGLRASILFASPIHEWTVAWRYKDDQTASTCFWTQEGRPFMHFTHLLKGAEELLTTGKPPWPVERTLLTSGLLDALLESRRRKEPVDTPPLAIRYQSDWNWQMPPPPPPTRPTAGQ
jgi:hypothetical protein